MFVDYNGDFALFAIGAVFSATATAFVATVAIVAVAHIVVKAAVDVGKKIAEAVEDATDKTKEAPKSVTKPTDTSSSEEDFDSNKDSRLNGKPGEIKKEGNKETHIGIDGRADKERHHTDHGNPKYHTNPHDHDISWNENGTPSFGNSHNYWDGNIPVFP